MINKSMEGSKTSGIMPCSKNQESVYPPTKFSTKDVIMNPQLKNKLTHIEDSGLKIIKLNERLIVYSKDSTKPDSFYTSNYNGKVTHSESRKKVICRNLSMAVAHGRKPSHWDQHSIAKDPLLNDDVFWENRHGKVSSSAYYFHIDHLQGALYRAAKKVTDQEAFLLHTSDHCMEITIKKKGSAYQVEFYEPNKTRSKVKAFVSSLEEIKNLSINDFCSKWEAKINFGSLKNKNVCLLNINHTSQHHEADVEIFKPVELSSFVNVIMNGHFGCGDTMEKMDELLVGTDVKNKFEELKTSLKNTLYFSYEHSFQNYLRFLFINDKLTQKEKMEILNDTFVAQDSVWGDLSKKLHNKMALVFLEEIHRAQLYPDESLEFLKPFAMMINKGLYSRHVMAEDLKRYTDAFLTFSFDNNQLYELLRILFSGRELTLRNALGRGQTQVIHTCLECCKNADLTPEQLLDLMSTSLEGGEDSGLVIALYDGKTDCIKTFMDALKDSDLAREDLAELMTLAGPSSSVLKIAEGRGHTKAVDAYKQGMRELGFNN